MNSPRGGDLVYVITLIYFVRTIYKFVKFIQIDLNCEKKKFLNKSYNTLWIHLKNIYQ